MLRLPPTFPRTATASTGRKNGQKKRPLDGGLFAAGEVDEGVGVIRVIAAEEGDTAGRVVHHTPVEAAQLHGLAAVQIVEDGAAVLTALEAGDAHAAGRDGAVLFAGEQFAGGDVVKGFAGDAPV